VTISASDLHPQQWRRTRAVPLISISRVRARQAKVCAVSPVITL